MSKPKTIVLLIIAIQIVIIFYLLYTISLRDRSHTIFPSPIEKDTIRIFPTDTLKYYYEPKPGIVITEKYGNLIHLSYTPKYTINKDTLNDRFNYTTKNRGNTYRIITLGDSFTYGQYINTKDNWPEKLEERLKTCKGTTFEVINLAVSGYDIQYSVERYKKRGAKYKPNLIIWFLKSDDFLQINEITLPNKMRYLEEMKKNGEMAKSIKKGEYFPHSAKAIQEFTDIYGLEKILSKQLEIMHSINTYYSGNMLIFSPEAMGNEVQSVITEFAKKRNNTYTYFDILDFSRLADRHPSKEGHEEIVQAIYNDLIRKKLISCD